jgi:hypothetical protein
VRTPKLDDGRRPKRILGWYEIERFMLLAFRGVTLTPVQQALLNQAYRRAPKEYSKRHRKVKDAEIERIKNMCP